MILFIEDITIIVTDSNKESKNYTYNIPFKVFIREQSENETLDNYSNYKNTSILNGFLANNPEIIEKFYKEKVESIALHSYTIESAD